MKFLYLLLFVSFLVISCSETESKIIGCSPACDDYQDCINKECQVKSDRCESSTACTDGEICNVNHYCVKLTNVCDGITCSDQGSCVIYDNEAKCNCKVGYKEEGLTCVPDECNGVTCSNHGSCEVTNGAAVCNCYDGYHSDGTNCIVNVNPCDSVSCSGHGTCNDSTGIAICACDTGYYVDGTNCLKEGSPCDNVDCGNGVCNDATGNAVCVCDTGYHTEGLKCVKDNNPCDSVNCGNGVCVINNDTPTCNCDDGYALQGLTCVKISAPCDNQNCSNKGVCENINGVATCNCDDGYLADGLSCVKVAVIDWCKIVGPITVNATAGDDEVSVFAQIFSQGLTEEAGANDLIVGGLGYTAQEISYPINNNQLTWVDAEYNELCDNCGFNDEYFAKFPTSNSGIYKYIFRFSIDSGVNWSYCDINSKIEGVGFQSGVANITEPADPCNEVTCSNHGVCNVVNNTATCICDAGYNANALECIVDATPEVEWCNVQYPNSFTALVGSDDATKLIFGQVFIPNITSSETSVSTVKAELGYTTANLTTPINPGLLEWKPAEFNQKANSNHEYKVSVTFSLKGVYKYIYRFSADNGSTWKYCHISGLINNGDTINPGVATINGLCDNITCSDHGTCSVTDGRASCSCEAGYELSDDKLNCTEMPSVDWCAIQYPKSINNEVSDTPIDIYGQVYIAGITEQSTQQTQIKAQMGYLLGDAVAYPVNDTLFTWVDAGYHDLCSNCGNNDEYFASFPINVAGNYQYLYRFSVDNGQHWAYCGQNNVIKNEIFTPGVANIFESGDPCDGITCSDHGVCTVEFEQALCNCEAGYHPSTTQQECEADPTPEIEWCSLISPTEINLFTDDVKTIPVYSQVFIPTITTLTTENPSLRAQQGFMIGEITDLSSGDINWVDATFFGQKYGTNHEYKYDWLYDNNFTEDTIVEYIYRFSMNNGGTWTYCDRDGKVSSDATEVNGGKVTITKRATPQVEWCNVQSPQHINALVGDSQLIYGQLYINGVTTLTNQSSIIKSQFAITDQTVDSYSDFSTLNWNNASFNVATNNNHEYMFNQTFNSSGFYTYFYRFSTDNGQNWTICDIDGVVLSQDITFTPGTANIATPIDACTDVTCSNHGDCVLSGSDAYCNCDEGYVADGLACIDVNNTYHTVNIDGSISDWSTQYTDMGNGFSDTNNPINTFVTWDTENLYVAITGKDLTTDADASFEIYFDHYKGYDLNTGVEYLYDNDNGFNSRVLPSVMKADKYLSIGMNGATLFGYNTPDANVPYWDTTGTPLATISYSGTVTELSIPLSALTLESNKKLAIAMYLTNHTNDYVYATWPTENQKGEDNVSGSENDTFYQFTIIEDQQPNQQ